MVLSVETGTITSLVPDRIEWTGAFSRIGENDSTVCPDLVGERRSIRAR